jgi:hypothetical protein
VIANVNVSLVCKVHVAIALANLENVEELNVKKR